MKSIFLCLLQYLILHCRWRCLRVCCRRMGWRSATECSYKCLWSPRLSSRSWLVPAWGRYTRSSLGGSHRRNSLPGSITQRWAITRTIIHSYMAIAKHRLRMTLTYCSVYSLIAMILTRFASSQVTVSVINLFNHSSCLEYCICQ